LLDHVASTATALLRHSSPTCRNIALHRTLTAASPSSSCSIRHTADVTPCPRPRMPRERPKPTAPRSWCVTEWMSCFSPLPLQTRPLWSPVVHRSVQSRAGRRGRRDVLRQGEDKEKRQSGTDRTDPHSSQRDRERKPRLPGALPHPSPPARQLPRRVPRSISMTPREPSWRRSHREWDHRRRPAH
jgi:hypothetical protein